MNPKTEFIVRIIHDDQNITRTLKLSSNDDAIFHRSLNYIRDAQLPHYCNVNVSLSRVGGSSFTLFYNDLLKYWQDNGLIINFAIYINW